MPSIPQLSVVVPVRNEAENIGPVVDDIRAALDDKLEYEVIYVDDGSSDDTRHRLDAIKHRFPRLRVMRHSACCGQSAAIASGVLAAQSEWIATLDGDGQNDPADIFQLISLQRSCHADLVCGYRKSRQDTWMKRASSRIANKVRGKLLKDNMPDTGCGVKLFRRETFLSLPHFDHMHRFLPALILRSGGKITHVEVNHRPRARGRSNYGVHDRLWVGIVDMLGVMWLQRRIKIPVVSEGD
jgi:dolichol-phosphate mannosyltransferase